MVQFLPASFPPCKNGSSLSASGGHAGLLCKLLPARVFAPSIRGSHAAASHGRCSHGICCGKKEKACHYSVEAVDESIIGKCISTTSCGKWRRSLLMLNFFPINLSDPSDFFCWAQTVMPVLLWLIVALEKALTLYMVKSQQSGTNGATYSVVLKNKVKTSSLWLGADTKGGIDGRKDWSFVSCPTELAEETALSQTLIQNANGISFTWETYSKPILCECCRAWVTQHRHVRNAAVLNGILTFKNSFKDIMYIYSSCVFVFLLCLLHTFLSQMGSSPRLWGLERRKETESTQMQCKCFVFFWHGRN